MPHLTNKQLQSESVLPWCAVYIMCIYSLQTPILPKECLTRKHPVKCMLLFFFFFLQFPACMSCLLWDGQPLDKTMMTNLLSYHFFIKFTVRLIHIMTDWPSGGNLMTQQYNPVHSILIFIKNPYLKSNLVLNVCDALQRSLVGLDAPDGLLAV